MRLVAEALADSLMRTLGMPRAPTVDVADIAAQLHVKVRYAALPGDGRIDLDQVEPTVELKSRASVQAQRFTLAHELCHLLLADPDVLSGVRGFTIEPSATERLCQTFAAELLMPRGWVRDRFRGAPIALQTVAQLGEEAAVSMSAAHVRLSVVHHWRTTMLLLDRDNRWLPLIVAGAPAESRGRITLGEAGERTLDAIHERCSEARRSAMVTLEFIVRGASVSVPVQIWRSSPGRFLALAPLRSALGR